MGKAPNLVQVYSEEGAVSVISNKVSNLQGLYILHSLEGAAGACLGPVLCPLRGQECEPHLGSICIKARLVQITIISSCMWCWTTQEAPAGQVKSAVTLQERDSCNDGDTLCQTPCFLPWLPTGTAGLCSPGCLPSCGPCLPHDTVQLKW